MDKGVGLGCIHYAVELPKGEPGDDFLKWIGGYFEAFWSVNPTWTGNFTQLPQLEVTKGVKPFTTHDEWYYHMRFAKDMKGVTPILSAVPPLKTVVFEAAPPDATSAVAPLLTVNPLLTV